MHSLLLQKGSATGPFELVVWDDHPAGSGDDHVTVDLGATFNSVSTYDPTVGTDATPVGPASSVPLALTDHPIIVVVQ